MTTAFPAARLPSAGVCPGSREGDRKEGCCCHCWTPRGGAQRKGLCLSPEQPEGQEILAFYLFETMLLSLSSAVSGETGPLLKVPD